MQVTEASCDDSTYILLSKAGCVCNFRVCAAAAMLPIIKLAGSMLTACTCRLVYLSCHVPTLSTVVLLVTRECECSGLIASPQE